MKAILLMICTGMVLSISVWSQAPHKMTFQAVVRNASDELVTDTQAGVRISILQSAPDGPAVFVETHTPEVNSNGLMTLEIGTGMGEQGEFSAIDWAIGPYFLKTETDPDGGDNYSISSVSQLLSVPYALYAESAGNAVPGPQGEQGPQGPPGDQGPQGEPGLPGTFMPGQSPGDMYYWNGSEWSILPAGVEGEVMHMCSGVPTWGSCSNNLPFVETSFIQSITQTSAACGGVVYSDGGSPVTSRGVCWGTSANPTVLNSLTLDGAGIGAFSSAMNGLIPNQTYFVRAYATNANGTYYGNQFSFHTTQFYAIGDTGPAGGEVFYDKGFYSSGWRYLEVSPDNWTGGSGDPSASWGCAGTPISGADGTAIGTGSQNTLDIISGCAGDGTPASVCDNAVINGYDDWFLGSLAEYTQLYNSISGLVNITFGTVYWTSTESTSNNAWYFRFTDGLNAPTGKNGSHGIRPIRSF